MSETAAEPPQDEANSLNSHRNLALEATFINHNFSQQVLKGNIIICSTDSSVLRGNIINFSEQVPNQEHKNYKKNLKNT